MASMRRLSGLVFAIALSANLLGVQSGASIHTVYAADDHTAVRIAAKMGNLPASFTANAGQTDASVKFQVRTGRSELFFGASAVTMVLSSQPVKNQSALLFDSLLRNEKAVRLSFVNANPNAILDGLGQLPGVANFFVGSDASNWRTNIPTYAGVVYHALYPGIDLTYMAPVGVLKGTYSLAVGTDPALIRWRYEGVSSVQIDASSGDLLIDVGNGISLTEKLPVAWQIQDGQRLPVQLGYQIGVDGTVGFALSAKGYDRALPLTIDPTLDYATYLGGNAEDLGYGIALDSSGNVYVTGYSLSTNFPTTLNAYQTTFKGGSTFGDVFISKLNATGTALIYSTYLGGTGNDKARSIVLDSSGNVYVAGQTDGGFPTTGGAYQTIYGGGTCGSVPCFDAFVAKLNPAGNSLLYSTYLGGSGDDISYQLALDSNGNIYVVGQTTGNFPTTAGAVQATFGGNYDAFVSKLNPAVSGAAALVYSTYLGGTNTDIGRAIAVDSAGNAYISGYTTGNYPTTSSAYQPTFGGNYDAFVTKLNPAGTALLYSSYIGGNADDDGYGIALDANRNAYVVGLTSGGTFPVSAGAYQTLFGGGSNDVFVSKINPTGTGLVYSTYLGGNGQESIFNGISVDPSGDVFLTGSTTSSNFPVTNNASQSTFSGGVTYGDAFVTKLSASGTNLIYSTYLGGSNEDSGHGIAIDGNSNVYITGWTNSGDIPITPGALQNVYGGGNFDAFVSEFTALTGRIDTIGIFRSGTFYMRLYNSTGNADIAVAFNPASQPNPVVGDWTGSGIDTVGIYDQSTGVYSLCTSNSSTNCANSSNVISFVLGKPADQPLGGRWLATSSHFGAGIFRPSNGLIYLKNNLTTGYADLTMVLGIPGDVGLAGDWDGDTLDSPGVYRPSNQTFYLTNKVCNCIVYGDFQLVYGNAGDTPVVGDWIGQGHDGVGLFRKSNGYTYLKNQLATGYADISFTYGIAGDVPVAGHWQLAYPPKPPIQNILVPPTKLPSGIKSPSNGLGD